MNAKHVRMKTWREFRSIINKIFSSVMSFFFEKRCFNVNFYSCDICFWIFHSFFIWRSCLIWLFYNLSISYLCCINFQKHSYFWLFYLFFKRGHNHEKTKNWLDKKTKTKFFAKRTIKKNIFIWMIWFWFVRRRVFFIFIKATFSRIKSEKCQRRRIDEKRKGGLELVKIWSF